MPLVDDPCEVVVCESGCCGDCGADLTGAQGSACRGDRSPMSGRRHLHRAGSGAVRPRGVGPGVGKLLCWHYLPVGRVAGLIGSLLGVRVSTGSWPDHEDMILR